MGTLLCGNTTLDEGETCEDGNLSVNDRCPSGPLGNCQEAYCGDGYAWVEGYGANEECDDGNALAGDGCDHCQLEENWVCEVDGWENDCWCAPGFQNNDGDSTCLPSCDNIDIREAEENEICDDSSGEVFFTCAAGAFLEPEDGRCELKDCDPVCGIHRRCVNTGSQFQCECRPYWVGADCGTCRVFVDPEAGCASCDGSSWATAFTTIAPAIAKASDLGARYSQHCEVWLKKGRYFVYSSLPTDSIQLKPWVSLLGGFDGSETDATERDWRENRTILDGHAALDSADRVWHVVTGASHTVVDGVTVTGGSADGQYDDASGVFDDDGGGLLLEQVEDVQIKNTTFVENRALTEGGAARISNTSVVFDNCAFIHNHTFNQVQYNRGGAITGGYSEVELRRVVFAGNWSDGNIVGLASPPAVDVTNVINALFVGNEAGAIFDNNWCPTRFFHATFANNEGGEYGSIMHNWYQTIETTNCIFANHQDTELYHNGAATSVSYSLLDQITCGGNGANCLWGDGNVTDSPHFAAVPGTNQGVWDAVSWDPQSVSTTFTDADAAWSTNGLVGFFVRPTDTSALQVPIWANTDSTIIAPGNFADTVAMGDTYQLYDYHLAGDSPAIDMGTDLSGVDISVDVEGNPRGVCHIGISPNCYDAGAFERQ